MSFDLAGEYAPDQPILQISLLGRFCLQIDGKLISGLENKKAEELLCYLLLHRERPHTRESLADLLWDEISSNQAKNYLRKTIWQLQVGLESISASGYLRMLVSDGEWLELNPQVALSLDVALLEDVYQRTVGRPGRELRDDEVRAVERAVVSYRGDLLEGWYQDWCLYERERLQYQYLVLLDKMMDFCESRRLYENGLAYGEQILRYDRARERTHRKLMRLFYLAGDRTAALRHYEKCVAALREELGVEPAKRTRLLCKMIEADQLDEPAQPLAQAGQDAEQNDPLLRVFNHLGAFQESLNRLQAQLSKDILAFQKEIKRRN